MLTNPSHLLVEPELPRDWSGIGDMFAAWCGRQGAITSTETDGDVLFVYATRGDNQISAAFDVHHGRFLRDGMVATPCEFGSATTLYELARALRTGHRRGGHRS